MPFYTNNLSSFAFSSLVNHNKVTILDVPKGASADKESFYAWLDTVIELRARERRKVKFRRDPLGKFYDWYSLWRLSFVKETPEE